MQSAGYSGCVCAVYGVDGVLPRMSAVDDVESAVAGGLGSVFHHHECALRKRCEILQQSVGHAVWSGAYDQSHHVGASHCLLVEVYKMAKFAVGVGIGLKISQILHVGIFLSEECAPFLNLFAHRQRRAAVFGVERLVVAVCASAGAF